MIVEINLVNSNAVFGNVYSLIARDRKECEGNSEIMGYIISFIKENITIFDAALSDKDLVTKMNNLEAMTISEFYSLKFILAQSGIDILVHQVAEMEVNATEIPQGKIEYSVIDNLDYEPVFIRTASKIVVDDDNSNLSTVYGRVIEAYDYFNSELTNGYSNPLMTNLEVVKKMEQALGVSPTSITSYINSVFQYLGKDFMVITN